jgi:hypothetical protein
MLTIDLTRTWILTRILAVRVVRSLVLLRND